MRIPKVVCFTSSVKLSCYSLFVLNKGNNAGKPLQSSCPNCFVLHCNNQNEYDFYYWLLYGLHTTKAFNFYLKGSVIPYITIRDFKELVFTKADQLSSTIANYHTTIAAVNNIKEIIATKKHQIDLLQQYQKVLLLLQQLK